MPSDLTKCKMWKFTTLGNEDQVLLRAKHLIGKKKTIIELNFYTAVAFHRKYSLRCVYSGSKSLLSEFASAISYFFIYISLGIKRILQLF